jgi:hypothetical protein
MAFVKTLCCSEGLRHPSEVPVHAYDDTSAVDDERTVADRSVEYATMAWVDTNNNRRQHCRLKPTPDVPAGDLDNRTGIKLDRVHRSFLRNSKARRRPNVVTSRARKFLQTIELSHEAGEPITIGRGHMRKVIDRARASP